MENEMVTISARIPKRLNDELERFAKKRGYASKTEVLRELLRAELFRHVREMKGALKGKVSPYPVNMSTWRRRQWKQALKQSGGDRWKAIEIIKKDEDAALKEMGLEDL